MPVETYSKILRLKTTAKKIQQLSWTISDFERKVNSESADPKEYPAIIRFYLDMIPQLKIALKELKDEEDHD